MAVRDLLEPGESLADASTWADEHRRDVEGSGAWHYVNVPLTEAGYDSRFCKSTGCVVSKIVEFRDVLRSSASSRDDKRFALRMMVHLVEDLHQPMHVGDHGDRGGNDLQLRFFRRGTNLHRVWDEDIIEHFSTDEAKWETELNAAGSPDQIRRWSSGTVESWATESLVIARSAYCFAGTSTLLTPGSSVDEAYYDEELPVVRMRLAQAAVRLRRMLEDIFVRVRPAGSPR